MRSKSTWEMILEEPSESAIKEAWNDRVKTKQDTISNWYKVRDNLDILEYNADVSKRKTFYTPNEIEERRLIEIIKEDDPDFDSESFEKLAESVYRKFVEAYCKNNIDSMRKYMDVNIIEFYKLKEYQNQMLKHTKYIDIVNINFVDFFGYHKEADLDIISVAIGVVCYNYMKNGNNEIISGSDSAKQTEVILLSFARKSGAKTIKSINEFEKGQNVCPNCGAKITSITNICEHCGTALYNSTSSWIINHMEVL